MVTRRAIRGVLGGFLGTYTSRYSDFEGYWLFGFLVADLDVLQIDLLAEPSENDLTPRGVAVQIAVSQFADQVQKAGLELAQIQDARLLLQRSADSRIRTNYGFPHVGSRLCFDVRFSVAVVMERGMRYEREAVVFVAPHDPRVERCSGR